MQREARPGAIRASGGGAALHSADAFGQRGAK
jgi:hypothetical protein